MAYRIAPFPMSGITFNLFPR